MKYIISIFFSCIFLTANAQDYIDIVNVSYSNTPSNNFKNSIEETKIEEFGLQLNYPVVLNDKNTLLTGFSATKTNLRLDTNLLKNTSLTSIGLKLGLNQVYSDKWTGTYLVLPKITSDKGSIDNKDFQVGLLSLFTYTKKNNLKYKFGVYANTEKYGTLIVPLVGLYYQSLNKKWEVNLTLPVRADVNYLAFKKTTIGVNFDGLSSTYNSHNTLYNSKKQYIAKTSNELFTYLNYQLTKSLYLKTKVGYAISRNYKVYDSNDKIDLAISSIYLGDNRTELNKTFDTGAIFKVEFLYRFHFK